MQQPPKLGAAHSHSKEVEALTQEIISAYRRTTEELIRVGRCLAQIKSLMSYQDYVRLLKERLRMSPSQSVRLIALYEKFHDTKNEDVLKAKPAVLYLLADANNSEVEKLISGKAVDVRGGKKLVAELSVKEAKKIVAKKEVEEPFEFDRCLASLLEEALDELTFFIVEAKALKNIPNKKYLREYIKEVKSCFAQLENILR